MVERLLRQIVRLTQFVFVETVFCFLKIGQFSFPGQSNLLCLGMDLTTCLSILSLVLILSNLEFFILRNPGILMKILRI